VQPTPNAQVNFDSYDLQLCEAMSSETLRDAVISDGWTTLREYSESLANTHPTQEMVVALSGNKCYHFLLLVTHENKPLFIHCNANQMAELPDLPIETDSNGNINLVGYNWCVDRVNDYRFAGFFFRPNSLMDVRTRGQKKPLVYEKSQGMSKSLQVVFSETTSHPVKVYDKEVYMKFPFGISNCYGLACCRRAILSPGYLHYIVTEETE
jgi:hypothetical protein